MPTKHDVALRALRMIGVVAADEPGTSDQIKQATDVLDSLFAEVCVEFQPVWDIETGVPQEAFVPLATLLASELASEYAVQSPVARARAKLRLLAIIRPRYRRCH